MIQALCFLVVFEYIYALKHRAYRRYELKHGGSFLVLEAQLNFLFLFFAKLKPYFFSKFINN